MEESQNKSNPMIVVAALAVLLLLGVGIFYMQRSNSESQTGTANPASGTRLTDEELSEEELMNVDNNDTDTDIQIVDVEGGSFYFKPNEIRVPAGQPVRIVLRSVDMMHDFVIDELNIKTEITRSGETNSVEFTPTTPGTYEFYCSVGNHRQQGQIGKLIVE